MPWDKNNPNQLLKIKEAGKRQYTLLKTENPKKLILYRAKASAKRRGIIFDLSEDDFDLVDICPILLIPIVFGVGNNHPGTASLDRIDNTQGYIKGNIRIISNRANTIKSNLTLEQAERLVEYMRGK